MKTLADLIENKNKRKFTNRNDEIRLFNSLLELSSPKFNVLAVYGTGGVGKTTLLDEFERSCQKNDIPAIRVDGSIHQTIIKFVRSIRKQLPGSIWRNHFRHFDQDINRYLEIQSKIEKSQIPQQVLKLISNVGGTLDPTGTYNRFGKETVDTGISILLSLFNKPDIDFYIQAETILAQSLVDILAKASIPKSIVMLDTYEQFPADVRSWVERDFAPRLSASTILVLSGRQRFGGNWVNWESSGVLKQIELISFNKDATREMLYKAGITENSLVDEVFEFTQGHPLCIALTTEIGVTPDKKYVVLDTLIERILDQVTDSHLVNLLELCAVPRWFNQDIVNFVSGNDINDITPLLKYSFVRATEQGFILHDLLRNYLIMRLRQSSPVRWQNLNESVSNYFQEKVKNAHDLTADWVIAAAEIAYHQLNLSETTGIEYCRNLFARADALYDLQLAASVVNELEEFPFKNKELGQWYRILHIRYEYIMKRDWKKASEEYSAILNYVGDSGMKVVVLNGLALVLVELNRLDESRIYAEQALVLADKLNAQESSLAAAYTLAKVFQRQGAYQDGISLLNSHLPKDGNQYFIGLILERLGLLHLSVGQVEKAGEYYQRALKIWREMGSEWKAAIAQHGLAGVMSQEGKWLEATNLLEKSLSTLERIGDIDGIARCLSRLARAKIGTDDFQQAIILAERSMEMYWDLGDRYSWALALNVSALAYRKTGNLDKALSCYQQSLIAAQDDGNRARQIETLLNLARVYLSMENRPSALNCATKALDLTQDVQSPHLREEAIKLLDTLHE